MSSDRAQRRASSSPSASALADVPRLAASGALELAARRVVEGLHAGGHRSPFSGSAVEFADHRPYLAGDDLRAVDWKVFARSDRLVVRRYREERDLPVVLLLDTSASMAWSSAARRPSKLDFAAVSAAALALLAIDHGDRVRIAGGSAQLTTCDSERGGAAGAVAVCALLADLAATGAREAERSPAAGDLPALLGALALRLRTRSLIVVLSDLLGDPALLAPALSTLAARGHDLVLYQTLDPAERDLPAAWGLTAIDDPEGRVPRFTCDAAASRADYARVLAAHRQALAQLAATCRADVVEADTARQVADVLGAWLVRR